MANPEQSSEQVERVRVAYTRSQYPWIQFDPPETPGPVCSVCKGSRVVRVVRDLELLRGRQVVQLEGHTLADCPICGE